MNTICDQIGRSPGNDKPTRIKSSILGSLYGSYYLMEDTGDIWGNDEDDEDGIFNAGDCNDRQRLGTSNGAIQYA